MHSASPGWTNSCVLRRLFLPSSGADQRRKPRDYSSKLSQPAIRFFTPTEKNWLESGQILRRIQRDHGFEPVKLRDLHFDVLIALTARTQGARLITSNRADFELIREYRDFKLDVW